MTATREVHGRLETIVEGDGSARRVVLRGRLDESAQLAARVEGWAAREVVLDTGDVTLVNSIGVRDWMRLLRGLTDAGGRVRLVRCAEVLIEQINMIDDAVGSAEVESFKAPYQCTVCGLEASMLIEVGPHADAMRRMETPPQTCPECGQPMELYEVPEKFFTFLVRDRAPA